jgi:hypothetical protein
MAVALVGKRIYPGKPILPQKGECLISKLPVDVVALIASFSSLDQTVKLAGTCSSWRKETQALIKSHIERTTSLSYRELQVFGRACTEGGSKRAPELKDLLQKFQNLRTFILGKTMIPDNQLLAIGKALSAVKTIDASEQNLKGPRFSNLISNCPELEILSVARCPTIDSGCMLSLVMDRPLVKELNLSSTSILDCDLAMIAVHCTHLQRIHITGCKRVTGLGIAELTRKNIEVIR